MRIAAALIGLLALTGTSCQRERRNLRPEPATLVVYHDAARESTLEPGGALPHRFVPNPTGGSAYDSAEVQRLYTGYNCGGCHFHGGGGIGPPLIKEQWIYGGEPENIFDTIVKGRPNGMPTWGGRVPEYQIWQIVAYVRALNQQEPSSATPVRSDDIVTDPATVRSPGVPK